MESVVIVGEAMQVYYSKRWYFGIGGNLTSLILPRRVRWSRSVIEDLGWSMGLTREMMKWRGGIG